MLASNCCHRFLYTKKHTRNPTKFSVEFQPPMMSFQLSQFIFIVLIWPSQEIPVKCNFNIFDYQYCCTTCMNITADNTEFDSIISNHEKDHTDLNITRFDTLGPSVFTYLPIGLGNMMKSLQKIEIHYAGVKFIKRENFKVMEKLRYLSLCYNEIESIPENVFYDLLNLRSVALSSNKIKVLQEKLFVNSPVLIELIACDTELEVLERDLFTSNIYFTNIIIVQSKLRLIKVDFTQFEYMAEISFIKNPCSNEHWQLYKQHENILDFQRKLNKTCLDKDMDDLEDYS